MTVDRTHPMQCFPLPIQWVEGGFTAQQDVFEILFGYRPDPRVDQFATARAHAALDPRRAADLWVSRAQNNYMTMRWEIDANEKRLAWIDDEDIVDVLMQTTPVQCERCVVLMLLVGANVWLALRSDPARDFPWTYASPGGLIEPGETPEQAAMRELAEETSIVLDARRLLALGMTSHTHEDGRPFEMHGFLVYLSDVEIPRRTEPHKQGPWALWPIFSPPQPLTPGTVALLEQLERARQARQFMETRRQ